MSKTVSLVLRLALTMLLALGMAGKVHAQTAIAEWSDLGAGASPPAPNPGSFNASDGTSVSIDYGLTTDGGSVQPALGGSFVTYYTSTVGGIAPSLLMNMDNSAYDVDNKVTLNIALGRRVTNLRFSLGDIDRNTFRDAAEVYYDTGDGNWRNAADVGAYWSLGGGNVGRRDNSVMNGWVGEANTGSSSVASNVNFNFGSTPVERIRIVYFSYVGWGDPTPQIMAVSRLTFDAAIGADLSLNKSLLTSSPSSGNPATFRLTVINSTASSETTNGVQVRDVLPAGFGFTSASGTGNYDAVTGIWNVGSVAPGASVSIDITGTVDASPGATLTNVAEIVASSAADQDSTPDNGATGEDDYDTATLTVTGNRVAGIAPALSCPAGTSVFDWTDRAWSAGSTTNSYPFIGLGTIDFTMTNPGQWLNSSAFGGQSPNRQNSLHAGTFDWAIVQLVNLASRNDEVVTTIDLPVAMDGAQFTIFDVDFGNDQFADRVIVEGRKDGAVVLPTLTNGVVNYVIGNTAYGDGASDSDSPNGNVVVTFNQSVDTIIIRYGDHAAAPANPGQQAIALHDIIFCNPNTTLNVSKASSVLSDPVSGTEEPKAIPGAIVQYCILVQNAGTVTATGVVATDILPAGITFVPGSLRSGSTCETASEDEDDDASGSDESDPYGAAFEAGTATGMAASLSAGDSFAFTFETTVD